MRLRYLSIVFFFCELLAGTTVWAQQTVELPLITGSGGALEVSVNVSGQPVTFLVDTGAAMATINSVVFAAISDRNSLRKVREVAAKMADGRTRKLDVYEIEVLQLVGACDIGPTEVLVVPGSGRNLLGLNVLSNFAPLTLSLNPPALGLSNCELNPPAEAALQEVVAAVAP